MNLNKMDNVLIEEIETAKAYLALYSHWQEVQAKSYNKQINYAITRVDWLESLLEVRWDL